MASGTAGGPPAPRALCRAPAAPQGTGTASAALLSRPRAVNEGGAVLPGTVLFMGTSEGLQGSAALVPGTSMH